MILGHGNARVYRVDFRDAFAEIEPMALISITTDVGAGLRRFPYIKAVEYT